MRKLALLFLSLMVMPISHAADIAKVSDAWVRLPPPGAQVAAAYLTLESKQALSLSNVTSPAAETVEIHSMSMHKDMMEMRQLPALALEAGKPVKLEPGGLHLMLINLKKPLKEGDKVLLVLNFNQGKQVAGAVGVQATVKAAVKVHTH
ncbi:MAG: copper chaperone PCu(A)C [Hydrogenophilales bacterium]|nr:copper chaperone PCu(A)C [Hydrogenophilales bacterium]